MEIKKLIFIICFCLISSLSYACDNTSIYNTALRLAKEKCKPVSEHYGFSQCPFYNIEACRGKYFTECVDREMIDYTQMLKELCGGKK